jgi:hypothetical protein
VFRFIREYKELAVFMEELAKNPMVRKAYF